MIRCVHVIQIQHAFLTLLQYQESASGTQW